MTRGNSFIRFVTNTHTHTHNRNSWKWIPFQRRDKIIIFLISFFSCLFVCLSGCFINLVINNFHLILIRFYFLLLLVFFVAKKKLFNDNDIHGWWLWLEKRERKVDIFTTRETKQNWKYENSKESKWFTFMFDLEWWWY